MNGINEWFNRWLIEFEEYFNGMNEWLNGINEGLIEWDEWLYVSKDLLNGKRMNDWINDWIGWLNEWFD